MISDVLRPRALLKIVRKQAAVIVVTAACPLLLLLLSILFTPSLYTASALVFVDPQGRRTVKEEQVLAGFGKDAAAVESLVEIAKSDGFLIRFLTPYLEAQHKDVSALANVDEELERFRQHLRVARRGLTYLVSVSFTSERPERSASVANAVANGLVTIDREGHAEATKEAEQKLNLNLRGLRDDSLAADARVASAKAAALRPELQNQETSDDVIAAKMARSAADAQLRAGEARYRLEQAQRAQRSGSDAGMRSELLDDLREHRARLADAVAQRQALLGDRHPDLRLLLSLVRQTDAQIQAERASIVESLRSGVLAADANRDALERSLRASEDRLVDTSFKEIPIEEMERQAAAQDDIYARYLGRAKYVREFALLPAADIRLVSEALVPARPRSTPINLGVFSLVLMIVFVALAAAVGREAAQRVE